MKKLLLLTLLLNFTFVISLFAQDDKLDESWMITTNEVIQLFDNLKNQFEKESNIDKIESSLIINYTNDENNIFKNKLDTDLYFIKYYLDSEEVSYSCNILVHKNKILTFNCTFSLPKRQRHYIRCYDPFKEELELEYLNQLFKVDLDNGIVKLDEKAKSVSYHKSFIDNIEEYKKINPKIIINHEPKKIANKTDRAVDFLMNPKSMAFLFNDYYINTCDFETALERISYLIGNKKVKELETILYTIDIKGKLLAAGALLYLEKNEGILLNSEIKERLDYILENEKKVEVHRSIENCKAYNNLGRIFLARDFEEIFEKYGTKITQEKSNNDIQER